VNFFALFMVLLGVVFLGTGMRGLTRRGPRTRGEAEQERVAVDGLEQRDDQQYDEMSPDQRDAHYVHPNLITRIKQFWTG
jgi:hypothetical protein